MLLLTIKSALLLMLIFLCLAILFADNFLYEVIYLAAFSLLMSSLYLVMSAPDVAITESAVGVCITTLLLLWCMAAIGGRECCDKKNRSLDIISMIFVLIMGSGIFYAILDLPQFGSPESPVHGEAYQYYLSNTQQNFGFPNIVTAILAGFRGYDTLGETVVVFTAAVSVLLLLGQLKKRCKNQVLTQKKK